MNILIACDRFKGALDAKAVGLIVKHHFTLAGSGISYPYFLTLAGVL